MRIDAIYVSGGHNFFGHHGREPGDHPMIGVDSAECVAGCGLKGDRFFSYKPGYSGQVTFFASEVHEALAREFRLPDAEASAYRRNILTTGADLQALIGKEFEVQGIRFLGMCECKPCHWMNRAVCPGAEDWLAGRAGLRAQVLTDGWLRVDPAP